MFLKYQVKHLFEKKSIFYELTLIYFFFFGIIVFLNFIIIYILHLHFLIIYLHIPKITQTVNMHNTKVRKRF